ncbi:Flp pilus assembly CpaF family ATPase [Streptomyces sp. V4I8]
MICSNSIGGSCRRPLPSGRAGTFERPQLLYDLLYRAGRLQPYLDDERVEDIIIQGPHEVWLDYGDGERRRVGPVAESKEELLELLRELARGSGHSERTISTAQPTLALSLRDGGPSPRGVDTCSFRYAASVRVADSCS